MHESVEPHLRVAAWLLLVGGSLATIGAWCPPYKQWYSPMEEGLRTIHGSPVGWYCIHAGFLSGTWVSFAGLAALVLAQRGRPGAAWAAVAVAVYGLAAACWTVNIGYRVTIWNWAADVFAETGRVPDEFLAWKRFATSMFMFFSVGAYLTVAGLGAMCLSTGLLPRGLSWTFVAWGLSAGFVVGYNVPFIAYVPFIIFGAYILRHP